MRLAVRKIRFAGIGAGIWAAALVFLGAASGFAAGPTFLAPPDGYRSYRSSVWVVVGDTATAPVLFIDGKAQNLPIVEEDGIYHFKVSGLAPTGTLVEVRQPEGRAKIRLFGGLGPEREPANLFHASKNKVCAPCHGKSGKESCVQCHSMGGNKHAEALATKCNDCHEDNGPARTDVVKRCSSCHKRYSDNRHPRLKHPVSSSNDPSRPGRPMSCISCHDPHAPDCLDSLDKKELRDWCKGCHAK